MHSGVALIAVDAQGENQILALPGANGLAGAPDPCGAAVWFCPGEVPRAAHEGTVAAARADGATAIVNPSPANAIDPEVVGQFDIAIVNETELHTFAGHLPARVVLTRGAAGAVLLPRGTELPAVPARSVDTTGAGRRIRGRRVRRHRRGHAARAGGAARPRDGRDLRRARGLPAVLPASRRRGGTRGGGRHRDPAPLRH